MRKNPESETKRMKSTSTQTVEQLDRSIGGRPTRRSARMGNSSSAGQINTNNKDEEEASDNGNGARSSASSSRERSSSMSSSGSSSDLSNRESGQSTNNDASSRSESLSEDSSVLETTSTNDKDNNRTSQRTSESRNRDRKKSSTQQKQSSRSSRSNGKSKNKTNSRRINAYFVLEHDLERPPRRRTRPTVEGETIGDALFFGDDLMFGTLNEGQDRLTTPWPEYLRKRLVDEAGLRLLVSGLPGRTSRWDDEELAKSMGEWAKPDDFNGVRHFGTLFSSHTPLWVVIALGSNDLKTRIRTAAIESANEDEDFSFRLDLPPGKARIEAEQKGEDDDAEYQFDADFVAGCVMSVALKAQHMFKGHCHEGNLRLLVVTPPPLRLTPSAMRAGFDMESVEISQQLQAAFARKGKEFNLNVISPVTSAEKLADGVHFTEEQAKLCAEEVWKVMSMEIPRRTKRVERVDF